MHLRAGKKENMQKDAKTMKEVAERCTQYDAKEGCGCTNSTGSQNVTCQTCTHYNTENVCDIDLYSEIKKNHNL